MSEKGTGPMRGKSVAKEIWAETIGSVSGDEVNFHHARKCADRLLFHSLDLEARLEKAEAERDALKALAERQLGQMIEKAAQARNDALEEAATVADFHLSLVPEHDPDNPTRQDIPQGYGNAAGNISYGIRSLKDKS
jgi:hypothetical protein